MTGQARLSLARPCCKSRDKAVASGCYIIDAGHQFLWRPYHPNNNITTPSKSKYEITFARPIKPAGLAPAGELFAMMESFALPDAAFDFNLTKHHVFTDEEIKQALQTDMESQVDSFAAMANATSFDYNSFFEVDVTLPKNATVDVETPVSTEEQPVPSIENPEVVRENAPSDLSPINLVASPVQQDSAEAPTSTTVDQAQAPDASHVEVLNATSGLKDPMVDPILFDFNDQLIAAGNEAVSSFEEFASMPALASPFQPTKQIADDFFDFGPQALDMNMMPARGQVPIAHYLPPRHFPSGRRRSQTAPPDFEPGISFQRRMNNGPPGPHNRHMYACPPQQSMQFQQNNSMCRPRYGAEPPRMMNAPCSYPITPPTRHPNPILYSHGRHDFHPPSRPQSLNPDLRLTLMNRGRELSPDRNGGRRATKRQKQSHDRGATYPGPNQPQETTRVQQLLEVDMGVFGVDQALIGIEFMLKEAVEKVRYGKESEVEKARSEARSENVKIQALDIELAAMASKKTPPMDVPKTGAQIKELNTQGVQALLDFFDIPFVSTMFLHDKKLLYLNFLGVSGALKHLVLD